MRNFIEAVVSYFARFIKRRSKLPLKIIAFDGPERTGKSTQIRLLKKYLQKRGRCVKVLHTSLLAGRDVTTMKIPAGVKDIAYLAALYQALLTATRYLLQNPKNVVIFDRFVLTQLSYCGCYSQSRSLLSMNQCFLDMCKYFLLDGYLGFCVFGKHEGKEDFKLNECFLKACEVVPNTRIIANCGKSISRIHSEIISLLEDCYEVRV